MSTPAAILTADILAAHGARPDVRLWRNAVVVGWVGKAVGRTQNGDLILRGARQIQSGLCIGAADLVGIGPGGLFTGIEVKAGRDRLSAEQKAWLECVRSLGGIGGEARSVEDVDKLLGRR